MIIRTLTFIAFALFFNSIAVPQEESFWQIMEQEIAKDVRYNPQYVRSGEQLYETYNRWVHSFEITEQLFMKAKYRINGTINT